MPQGSIEELLARPGREETDRERHAILPGGHPRAFHNMQDMQTSFLARALPTNGATYSRLGN